MNFKITNYEYEITGQRLSITLDTGGKLEISFEHQSIDLNGIGFEYDFMDDDLKNIFYKIEGVFYSALQIVQWADDRHESIRNEALQDEENEARYIEEVSSQYLSGRI